MNKEKLIVEDAYVSEKLPDAKYRVCIVGRKEKILACASGKMRKRFIKIFPGDKVKIEMSVYDSSRARIIYRYSKNK